LLIHDRLEPGIVVDHDLIALAKAHRVGGLLHHAVQAHDLDIEENVALGLARRYLDVTARVSEAHTALHEFVRRIGPDVSFGVAKGLALNGLLYPGDQSRASIDVDVIVHPRHFGEFGSLMSRVFGDQPTELTTGFEASTLDSREIDRLNRAAPVVPFVGTTRMLNGVFFDVHTDIAKFGSRPVKGVDSFWERMVDDSELGARRPDAELSLILSVLHAAKDGFVELRRHVDVARLLQLDLDWEFIEGFVRAEGWWRGFRAALDVICDAIDLAHPLPPASTLDRWIADTIVWPRALRLTGPQTIEDHRPLWHRAGTSLLLNRPVDATARAIAQLAYPPGVRVAATGDPFTGHVRELWQYWDGRVAPKALRRLQTRTNRNRIT